LPDVKESLERQIAKHHQIAELRERRTRIA